MTSIIPLSQAPQGARVRVLKVDAGRLLATRLYQMGLYPGSVAEVVVNRGAGPISVKVMGVTIALGRGMADKVLVEILP
ncbi:MAG: ferrous iron transport protein A [Desulfurococcales archaeon]|nr:ferrous iron transport protein A [Desulfurococcales archaeon]